MKKNIEQALAAFSYDEQRRMRDVITALDNGKVYSVEFMVMVLALPLNTTIQPPTTDCHAQCVLRSTSSKRK